MSGFKLNERLVTGWVVNLYLVLFFVVLLGPLVVMGVTAFNTPSYPQVWPIEGLTLRWFSALFQDQEMLEGLHTSVVIGVSVAVLSVAMGLAGALVMTQLFGASRSYYDFLVIAPVLIPGIVLGIATVVFWRDFTGFLGLRQVLYNGTVLTILAQSSFVSSYCMLIILARLQRFDVSQEEAALDLGASYPQVFRDVLLPFLRPALLSSAMLGFLTSFENYNATTFAILADKTLTTVLASHVRMGSSPTISALATVIGGLTILFALTVELLKRRDQKRLAALQTQARANEAAQLA